MRARVLSLALLAAAASAGPGDVPGGAHAERRARLRGMIEDGFALVFAQPFTDALQPGQEGHFLYLTGVHDQGGALFLSESRDVLFVPDLPEKAARFYGARFRPGEETARTLGVNEAAPAPEDDAQLAVWLADRLPEGADLHVPAYASPDQAMVRARALAVTGALARLRPDVGVVDLAPALTEMRAVKDAAELEALREAVDVTLHAVREALPEIRPGGSEGAVDGALLHAVRRRGAQTAFRFIVASGANSTIPHYFENDGPLRAGDLLLIDAGAAVRRYAADFARTFPVSGRFTERQREVYRAVLAAQRAGIAAIRPGATLRDVDRAARGVLHKAGLLEHALHATSHHVGLDVHDPAPPVLAPGMVITVEPGVYLEEEGFGARVEDMLRVTEDGSESLTASFPSEPEAIEALFSPEPRPR